MIRRIKGSLWLYFSMIIFGVIVFISLGGMLAMMYLYRDRITVPFSRNLHYPLFHIWVFSVMIGAVLATFVGRAVSKPLQQLNEALKKLSNGDFNAILPLDNKLQEIRTLFSNYNRMVRELADIDTLRSEFVLNVSHEFKTPLSSIGGYATLLQDETLTNEERDAYIKKILSNTHQLSKLAENMLSLSKLENQENILHKTSFQLDEQIRKCIVSLETKWEEKSLEFDLELAPITYFGNGDLLFQVWSNIIDNAIKHSPMFGTVAVTLEDINQMAKITITDQGDGMSAEVTNHLFEKFYQGDNTRKEEGHGLGLAIVKRIVSLTGGEIIVESQLGEGATFVVTLPIMKDETKLL